MNNRFFVPVLALGIAALGAAASPSQAATASLQGEANIGNGGAPIFNWVNTVTMTDTSAWTDAFEYQSQDADTYGTVVVDGEPGNVVGPGTFTETEPGATQEPSSGHSISTWIVDKGNTPGSGYWKAITNVVTISKT